MVFAPKMDGGVAYNQPVQQPSAMEAIAGLFDFGLKTATAKSTEPKLTEDEKFAVAVREFEEAKGGAFKWDRKGMREFIFNYPQFTPQAKAYAEELGFMTASPEEIAVDATLEWFKTDEGILAVNKANQLPEEERDAFLAREVGLVTTQNAEIAKLERNAKELELQGTLEQKRWDTLKPTSKDFVDNTISTILGPIFDEVQKGVTVEVSPELKATLGIRYDTIDIRNINAVLADTKTYLQNSLRSKYAGTFGQDSLPSDEFNQEVFGKLDGMIKIGEQFDSPQEQAAVIKAIIDTDLYKNLDRNGVASIVRLAEVLPPESLGRLIGTMAEFDKNFAAAIADGGKVLTFKGIKEKVTDGSVADSQERLGATVEFFEHGFVPEFFVLMKEDLKKSKYNTVDENAFKKIVGDNIPDIIRQTNENPELRMEFQDFLNSDIQATIDVVRQQLPDNVELVFENGKATVRITDWDMAAMEEDNEMRRISGLPTYSFEDVVRARIDELPDGMNLNTINTKIATLGLLGPMGKEVQEALGLLNQNTTSGNIKGRGRGGRRKVNPTQVISGLVDRDIPQHIAEGFAMNIADESGFRTDINEANPIVPGSRGGFGLIQWTGPRRKALEAFAAERGVPVDDLDTQLDFLVQELGGTESAAWKRIAATTTKEQAAAAILNAFLRPAESHRASREAKYLGGAGGFEARGAGSAPQASGEAPTLALTKSGGDLPEGSRGASTASTEALGGTPMSFDTPEVQQIVELAQSAPEEAIAMAKELLAKPMDPAIKALIEALVRIGERA